ncbi:MAG: signal peptide peptidase SppA [gamma proteobacterium symbiont of Bathyaustriella thionipta]|nr:signal peptide peptidase SppA [gamma proteobacterium symbiont of Bathyaustriella thionipta]
MNDQKSSRDWHEKTLEELVFASLKESRRARRWSVFFKLLMFAYLVLLLVLWSPVDWLEGASSVGKDHTALVDISGVISAESKANADDIVSGLRKAFKDKNTRAVIIRINSPGGSPVQAGYVNDEINRLKEKYPDIPVYAVLVDVAASGGYYIAVGADEIYADKGSIVGSIGVLMNGFGFVDTMKAVGIERRLYTAGEHKGMLDPFSPVKPGDRAHVQTLLDEMHQQFINVVKKGRGDRLQDDPDLFSGMFWSGETSVKLGLVDGLGSASYVAREIVGVEKLVDFTQKEDVLARLADRIGASASLSFMQNIGGLR